MASPSDRVLLDGGMGQELTRRWDRPASPLWSADILSAAPALVEAAHGDFIAAGAEVITLSAYAITPARLERAGRGGEFESLQHAAVQAARRARKASGRPIRIAGCLPPLVASYRPEEALPETRARGDYRRIVAAQADTVDLFLCETLPSIAEARIAAAAAAESGTPVWTAFTVEDGDGTRLRSGEALREAAAAAREAGAAAVLVNCSSPEATGQAIDALSGLGGVFGAYANGFVSVAPLEPGGTVDALEARSDLSPEAYARFALDWAEAGATILGGCCEVGPSHIAAIASALGKTESG